MIKTDAASVVKRYESLHAADQNWRSLWDEIAQFTIPRKWDILTKRGKGQKRTSALLYDSTAPDAVQTLAAAIHGSLTDPKFMWFSFDFDVDELNDDGESRGWLDMATTKLARAVSRSNFDPEIQEVYAEVASVATGAIFVDADRAPKTGRNQTGFGGLRWQSLAIGTYVMAEDELGQVDTLMQVHEMTARAAALKFGKAKLPDKYNAKLEDKPDELVRVLHAVFPREGVPRRAPIGTAARRLPWASLWIDMDTKELISEGGFHEFPFAVVRWTKQPGEIWGRGPGEIALPDIRTLNEAVKLRLQAWALAVRPPMEVKDRGVIGKPDTRPGANNYVREMGNLKPIDFGSRFDVANFNEEKIRESIKSIFFINQLQLPNKSIITATEANQRIRAMHRILGPTLGRMDYELLRRAVERAFYLMLRAGEFDPIPQPVMEAAENNAADINLRFDGPLARSQRAQDLEAMGDFVSAALPLAQADPGVLDKIDFDKLVDEAARATSMTRLLRPNKEVQKVRAARLQAAQAAQQERSAIEAAKAAGQAAPAIRELSAQGNPLDTAL